MSHAEERLALHIRAAKLPEPAREVKFHPERRWRFDFGWPTQKIAAEVEGGVFAGGRHTRGTGFTSDCEKYNAAAALGWRVLRFTPAMIESGIAVQTLEAVLK